MRTERTIRHTDTKRILQLCYDNGMTNEGISLRLNCSVRSIQKWWNDTCPSPRYYHRLWMLENSIKKAKEEQVQLTKQDEWTTGRGAFKDRMAKITKCHETEGHPDGECPECLRIMGIKTE